MYSQCPDCLTRFRVTAEVLRVAQGTVRCGRCGSAFNALSRLSDTPPPPPPRMSAAARDAAAATGAEAAGTSHTSEFHFSVDDIEKVFVEARDWQRSYGETAALEDGAESLSLTSEPSELLVDEGAPLEDITLEGERIQIEVPPGLLDDEEVEEEIAAALERDASLDIDATDRFKVLDDLEVTALAKEIIDSEYDDSELRPPPAPPVMAAPPPRPVPPVPVDEGSDGTVNFKITDDLRAQLAAAATAAAAPAAPSTRPAPAPATARDPGRIVAERAAPAAEAIPAKRWQPQARADDDELLPLSRGADETGDESGVAVGAIAWTVGCLVLALVLAAQVIHYFRQDIVRNPQLGPALSQVYDRLGLDLAPNWDPRAFELRQWGDAASTAKDGRMSVQASIRNKAAFAQPYPLLRLELEDRFGGTVATRDFEPAEYLKSPAQAKRMIAAGASADADLELVDPGEDAVGYRLNVCLRESTEILRCAQGPG